MNYLLKQGYKRPISILASMLLQKINDLKNCKIGNGWVGDSSEYKSIFVDCPFEVIFF